MWYNLYKFIRKWMQIMRRIICIGRQCGSNGHVIAQKVAEKLSIPCYDKEILKKAVQTSGLSRESG